MGPLAEVILPVFLVIAAGYAAVWRGLFSDAGADALMRFTQKFAIPCLLFTVMARLDLAANYDPRLLGSFYAGAIAGFTAGLLGGRYLFGRSWEDAVAFGFVGLFSNSVLLGLPIAERAYGPDALAPNFTVISIHAPFCYLLGITAMEVARGAGGGAARLAGTVLRAMFSNALVIGIALGIAVNLSGLAIPGVIADALDLMVRAALPVALFSLGGILVRYRPAGDMRAIAFVVAISLVLHPAITWSLGTATGLTQEALRGATITAAMAPGVNAFVFADMYGRARRVAASAVLVGTVATMLTAWGWLTLLG